MTIYPSTVQLLKKYKLRPKKSWGQNFLIEKRHLTHIVTAANLSAQDTVLEIGPGLGALSVLLAQQAQNVVGVDIDCQMIQVLKAEMTPWPNFKPVQLDILKIDPATLLQQQISTFIPGDPYLVVANLPYYITSAIIRHLLEAAHPPRRLIITLQKEVAERIVAPPGNLSVLAISVQFYGTPSFNLMIPASAFYPPPKVDSAVLRIDVYDQPAVTVDEPKRYFQVVKAGFSQKRKQLKNSLAAGLHHPQAKVAALMQQVGLEPSRRAQTLSLEEWAVLTKVLTINN